MAKTKKKRKNPVLENLKKQLAEAEVRIMELRPKADRWAALVDEIRESVKADLKDDIGEELRDIVDEAVQMKFDNVTIKLED